jgi:hypothetical protein
MQATTTLRNIHNEKTINNKDTTRTLIKGAMERKVRKECVKREVKCP